MSCETLAFILGLLDPHRWLVMCKVAKTRPDGEIFDMFVRVSLRRCHSPSLLPSMSLVLSERVAIESDPLKALCPHVEASSALARSSPTNPSRVRIYDTPRHLNSISRFFGLFGFTERLHTSTAGYQSTTWTYETLGES